MRRPLLFYLRFVTCCCALLITCGAAMTAPAQTASQVGQWSAVQSMQVRPVHAALLPNGKVWYDSYYDESLQPRIWDPKTNAIVNTAPISYRIFCQGHSFLADGRLLSTGGHITDFTGYKDASL